MYYRPRIIPVLTIIDNDLVKTNQFDQPRYLGDPINAVKIFNGKMVDELCVLDIRATLQGKEPNFELLQDIAAQAFMPLSYGGGLTTMEQVQRIIHMGYEKVVFNSSLWLNPDVVIQAVSYLGSSGVVASIDVKLIDHQYVPMISGGQIQLPIDLMQYLKQILSYQVGEIVINRIELDSAMTGYDETLIEFISSNCDVPVIALGGAGSIQDFKRAINAGAHAAGASSIFVYFGAKRTVLITHPSQKDIVRLWEKVTS